MKRRKFLKIGGIMAAAAAVPPATVNVQGFLAYSVQSIIKRELAYLTIDPEGLKQFSEDYVDFVKNFPLLPQQKFRLNIASVHFMKRNAKNSETVEALVSKFLFSSDFFINKMDESKTVKYLGMHHKNKAPCLNPFSHLYYPQMS